MAMLARVGLLVAFGFFPLLLSAAELLPELTRCEDIKPDSERLDCFDKLVRQLRQQSVADLLTRSQPSLLPQPSPEVLSSKLKTPESDMALSVQAFLDMIKEAELDEGGGIEILGWQQLDQSNYILWLKLRGRAGLTIQFYEKSKQRKTAVSVLESVVMEGQHINPDMFIMNIAAMGP